MTAGDRGRWTSAADAVSLVGPGDRVFVGSACATPRALVEALEQLDRPPEGVELIHFLTDRMTLQVGLGRVSNQMLAHLTNRHERAIHSDVITEPVADLVAAGVVTGPVVASFAMGTRRLYALIDDDARFSFHPIDYVCDPLVIAGIPRMCR
jgi:acyl-CoA hydrolase